MTINEQEPKPSHPTRDIVMLTVIVAGSLLGAWLIVKILTMLF